MRRPLLSPVLLRGLGGLSAASVLSGCLALSFGGKHEHIEPSSSSGSTAATLLHNAATSQRLEEMESRLQSLEQRCKNCPAETEASHSAPSTPILTAPIP